MAISVTKSGNLNAALKLSNKFIQNFLVPPKGFQIDKMFVLKLIIAINFICGEEKFEVGLKVLFFHQHLKSLLTRELELARV